MKRAYKYYKYFTFLIFTLPLSLSAQVLESASFLSTTPAAILKGFSSDAEYSVDTYKLRYFTTDVDGSQTVASGAVMIPINYSCDSLPMASYSHGTVLEREDVPSRDNFSATISKILASTGSIGLAPDYLGLGDNLGLHPYLHAESQATATLDLIRAAREFVQDSLGLNLNGEVYLTGYSQGGHAAMAAAKYVEDNNLLSEFNLIGAGPGSGPYNLSKTQLSILLSNSPYSNPGYVVYVLFAMQRVYGNIFQNYSEVLDSPYDTLIPPLFDGSVDMSVVNALLPNSIRGFMQDSVIDNLIADSISQRHPITLALQNNDNFDWNPSTPMELYYCTQDEQVDFQNSLDAELAMQANGANVVAVSKGGLNHGGCFIPALQGALDHFKQLRQPCQPVGITATDDESIQIYPQPAQSTLSIKGLGDEVIEIYRMDGSQVFSGRLDPAGKLDVSHYKSGIYILRTASQGRIKITIAR